jgi:hypothetical protein
MIADSHNGVAEHTYHVGSLSCESRAASFADGMFAWWMCCGRPAGTSILKARKLGTVTARQR